MRLRRRGFALVGVSTLERSLPILAKERKALAAGKLGERAVLAELGLADDNEKEFDCASPDD